MDTLTPGGSWEKEGVEMLILKGLVAVFAGLSTGTAVHSAMTGDPVRAAIYAAVAVFCGLTALITNEN